MNKDLVKLAEEYCTYYHKTQKRKAGNQEPYETHPFAVREILVRYAYDDDETQAIALLHDTIEDTELKETKTEIKRRFGDVVYDGVYILSNNTIGKNAKAFRPLFKNLGVEYTNGNGKLTPKAYKLRIMFSRDNVKRIKIADMIHNTRSLPDLDKEGIEKKIYDAEIFYIPLGMCVAPIMVKELIDNISNYKQTGHYQKIFENIERNK